MKKDNNSLWAKGYFAQSMGKKEMEEKEKTIHKKHDEGMNFNCKKCNTKISAHNKDWHDGMCDDCFNNRYFPEDSPENDTFSEANSKGKCRLCNKEFFGKDIKKHIKTCIVNQEGSIDSFLIKASSGPFWVYFSVPADKKLSDIDQFLRDLWLECCCHLSAFNIGNTSYQSADSELSRNEKSMNTPVKSLIKEGIVFSYEYDFGTTTELELECISKIKKGENNISILARNMLPDFRCEICDAKAEQVCVQCIWDGKGFVCNKCTKKHKCEEPYFLPVVNSPRTGMCGFTGEECKLLGK